MIFALLLAGLFYVYAVNPVLTKRFGSGSFMYMFGILVYFGACFAGFKYLLLPSLGNSYNDTEISSNEEHSTNLFKAAAFLGFFFLVLIWFCLTGSKQIYRVEAASGLEVLILN